MQNIVIKENKNRITKAQKPVNSGLLVILLMAVVILNAAMLIVQSIKGVELDESIIMLVSNIAFAIIISVCPVNGLVKFPWLPYAVMSILMLFGLAFGKVLLEKIYIGEYFVFDINSSVSMLFLVIVYLIVKYKNYSWEHLFVIYLVASVPACLVLMAKAISGWVIYFSVLVILLLKAIWERRLKIGYIRVLFVILSIGIVGVFLCILLNPLSLKAFIDFASQDTSEIVTHTPNEYSVAKEILNSTPFIMKDPYQLQELNVFIKEDGWEFILLLARYGWSVGLMIILGQTSIIVALYIMSSQIKNSYAKYLVFAIASYFFVRFVLATLQMIDVVPFLGIQFAFAGNLSANLIDSWLVGMGFGLYSQRNKITVNTTIDVDYDSTEHTLRFLRKELVKDYNNANIPDNKKRELLRTIQDMEKDEDDWRNMRVDHTEMLKKMGGYYQCVNQNKSRTKDLIFISYNQYDYKYAKYLCEAIEKHGNKCWYYQRNCKHGDYAAEIVKAIRRSKIFVVIISNNSNDSRHVHNEVRLAFGEAEFGTIIMPLKIEDISLSDTMEYWLGGTEWNTATTKERIDVFANYVSKLSNIEV